MRLNKKNFIASYLLSSFLILLLLFSPYSLDFKGSSVLVLLSFILNIVFVIKKLFWDNEHPYSFYMIFWFSNLVFLSLSPFFQYIVGWKTLRNLQVNDMQYLELNIYIFIYMLFFSLAYRFTKGRKTRNWLLKIKKINQKRVMLNFGILGVILFWHIYLTGFSNLFLRASMAVQRATDIQNIGLLLEVTIYSAIFLLLLNHEYFSKSSKLFKIANYLFSLFYLLILVFPLSRARFLIGTVYLGIFLNIRKKGIGKNQLTVILISAFIFILPFLSNIRFETDLGNIIRGVSFSSKDGYESFMGGEFTNYSMGLGAIQYVKNEGFLMGNQMLSNIFFFMPRSIWSGKEYSLGYTVAKYYGHHFYNMDSPIPAEFFVDFGIIGLIFFTIILGVISKKLDFTYWRVAKTQKCYLISYLYPFMVPMFLFINRGAFMSTFSRMIVIIIGFSLASFLYIRPFYILRKQKR